MALLHLEIVTPDQVVLDTYADYVGAPGVDGQFGVLAGHIPLLTALNIGMLYYRNEDENTQKEVFISGGFFEVLNNKITVLAQSAELACNIDANRAEAAKQRAEERILQKQQSTDLDRAEFALKKAIQRLSIAHKR